MVKNMEERIKTDVRLTKALSLQIDSVCEALGVTRNAFLSLAIAKFTAEMAQLDPKGKKPTAILRQLRASVNEVFEGIEGRQ